MSNLISHKHERMKTFCLMRLLLLFSLLAGCASTNTIESFLPGENRANIYIYRDSSILFLAKFAVKIDGQDVGELGSGTFIKIEVPAGGHVISSMPSGGLINRVVTNDLNSLTVIAATGNNYFFQENISSGQSLSIVDETKGRMTVSKLSKVDAPELRISSKEVKKSDLTSKETKVTIPTERLVLMPLRLSDADKNHQAAMETALVQGLKKRYIVFSGEQVSQKAREMFLKESRNMTHTECDETRCLQNIAEAFQSELIATASISNESNGYFLALSIQNIFDNKVIFSNSVPCKSCDAYEVVSKLKELSVF